MLPQTLPDQTSFNSCCMTQPKIESTPKKKAPRSEAIMMTMMVVITVSRELGHETLLVSARTSRMNLPGLKFATFLCSILKKTYPLPDSRPRAARAVR
jgi:hypothetical protein